MDWISVEERLPEKGEVVLCYPKDDVVDIYDEVIFTGNLYSDYEDQEPWWRSAVDYMRNEVTHWMPLCMPAPPKEAE